MQVIAAWQTFELGAENSVGSCIFRLDMFLAEIINSKKFVTSSGVNSELLGECQMLKNSKPSETLVM